MKMTRASAVVAASLSTIMAASSLHEGHADEMLSSAAKSMHGPLAGGATRVGMEEAKEYLRKVRVP